MKNKFTGILFSLAAFVGLSGLLQLKSVPVHKKSKDQIQKTAGEGVPCPERDKLRDDHKVENV